MRKWMPFLVLLLPSLLFGDGKFYVPHEVPPDMPYQRALLVFDGEREILVLQSKYEFKGKKDVKEFGWVVPLPSLPELASMQPKHVQRHIFYTLDRVSMPDVVYVRGIVFTIPVLSLLVLFIFALIYDSQGKKAPLSLWVLSLAFFMCLVGSFIVTFLSEILPRIGSMPNFIVVPFFILLALALLVLLLFVLGYRKRGRRPFSLVGALLLTLLLFVAFGVYITTFAGIRGTAGVEVLREEEIGVYDVKVVKGDDSGELVGWLNENGFKFDDGDREVFDDYIKRGWCFVTAKVASERVGEESRFLGREGLVAPLIMRFKTQNAVYPLALTATTGESVEVLLYVLAKRKMECDGRLELHYAGEGGHPLSRIKSEQMWRDMVGWEEKLVYPKDFFENERFEENYLLKFKSVLTPEQMRRDLFLRYAEDNEPYCEWLIRW